MARSKKSAVKKPAKKKVVKKVAKKAVKKIAAKKSKPRKKKIGFIPNVSIDKNINIKKKLKHEDHPEFIRIGFEEKGLRIK